MYGVKGREVLCKVKSMPLIVKSMALINKSKALIDKSKALICVFQLLFVAM